MRTWKYRHIHYSNSHGSCWSSSGSVSCKQMVKRLYLLGSSAHLWPLKALYSLLSPIHTCIHAQAAVMTSQEVTFSSGEITTNRDHTSNLCMLGLCLVVLGSLGFSFLRSLPQLSLLLGVALLHTCSASVISSPGAHQWHQPQHKSLIHRLHCYFGGECSW